MHALIQCIRICRYILYVHVFICISMQTHTYAVCVYGSVFICSCTLVYLQIHDANVDLFSHIIASRPLSPFGGIAGLIRSLSPHLAMLRFLWASSFYSTSSQCQALCDLRKSSGVDQPLQSATDGQAGHLRAWRRSGWDKSPLTCKRKASSRHSPASS